MRAVARHHVLQRVGIGRRPVGRELRCHAELGEAGRVAVLDIDQMRDGVTPVAGRIVRDGLLDRVERDAGGPLAAGVDVDVEARRVDRADEVVPLRLGEGRPSGRVGQVGVGLDQPRRVATLRAVADDLHDVDVHELAGDLPTHGVELLDRVVDRQRLHRVGGGDAERQRAALLGLHVERDDGGLIAADRRDARVEDRGDAGGRGLGQPALQQAAHGGDADGLHGVDQPENRVDLEHVAGGVALLVARVVAEARDRVGRVPVDAGHGQRLGIGPQAVPVDGEEEGRPVRQDGVEFGPVGALRGEHVDAPPEAADRAGRMRPRVGLDGREDLGEVVELQVDAGRQERAEERVGVALDEAGHQQPALEIHHLRGRAAQRHRAGRVTDMDDGVAAHRDGFGPGGRSRHRVDGTVVEHDVGRPRGGRAGRALSGAGVRRDDVQRQGRRGDRRRGHGGRGHGGARPQHRAPIDGAPAPEGLEMGRPITRDAHESLPIPGQALDGT